MPNERTLRGRAAIVGVGESQYYKHGQSPDGEFTLVLKAVLAACRDAGIDPKEINGFASYSNDRADPSRMAAALGIERLRGTVMNWGGGGGGVSAAVGHGASMIAAGFADVVVVLRGLAQGQFKRYGKSMAGDQTVSGHLAFQAPYGMLSPAQAYAMKAMRFMHEYGVKQEALRAISMASYHHAQANPRALMKGRPLDEEKYDNSRWIVEPFRLFDCCMENDGAAAVILVSEERAKDFDKPAYLLGASMGSDYRAAATAHNSPNYATSTFATVAPDVYEMAKVSPKDIGVVQAYENFTGGVMMALAEHGFFKPEDTNEFLRLENLIASGGKLPLNTSGGNLAECYMHGMELVLEAVRQVRGTSTSQSPRHDLAMVIGGPMVTPVSTLILGSEATL